MRRGRGMTWETGLTYSHCFCYCSVAKLCPTLWDPMDCSRQGSSVHENFPGTNNGMDWHFLLQGIFLAQGSNSCLLLWQVRSSPLSHQGSPYTQYYTTYIYIHIYIYIYVYIFKQKLDNQTAIFFKSMLLEGLHLRKTLVWGPDVLRCSWLPHIYHLLSETHTCHEINFFLWFWKNIFYKNIIWTID